MLTRQALRKLWSLSLAEWRDLLAAQYTLFVTAWRVWREPVGSLVVKESDVRGMDSGERERARALALANARAADHGFFRPACLVRALALQARLMVNGINGSAVRVGVRRTDGKFSAHAWIVWRGEVLGDPPEHVASFTEVSDLRVLSNR
jgi:hypothetical protein